MNAYAVVLYGDDTTTEVEGGTSEVIAAFPIIANGDRHAVACALAHVIDNPCGSWMLFQGDRTVPTIPEDYR